MKTGIQAIAVLFYLFLTTTVTGQETVSSTKYSTVTLQVPGVCDMCKMRIETATYDVAGVKKADWNIETNELTVIINPKKATKQKIADALAAIGYRSDLADADPKAYAELPGCCQYDSGIEKH